MVLTMGGLSGALLAVKTAAYSAGMLVGSMVVPMAALSGEKMVACSAVS